MPTRPAGRRCQTARGFAAVLVLDLVPLAAGADIEPPREAFDLKINVSHHGDTALEGTVHAAWIPSGASVEQLPAHADASTGKIRVEPFMLSDTATITVPPHTAPGRLVLWLLDDHNDLAARAFLDAAEVEPPNRRGARAGEFVDAPRVGR